MKKFILVSGMVFAMFGTFAQTQESKKTKTEEKKEGEVEFSVEEAKPDEKTLSEEELNQKAKDFGEYDPTLDLASFKMPPIELLKDFGTSQQTVTKEELEANKNKILKNT